MPMSLSNLAHPMPQPREVRQAADAVAEAEAELRQRQAEAERVRLATAEVAKREQAERKQAEREAANRASAMRDQLPALLEQATRLAAEAPAIAYGIRVAARDLLRIEPRGGCGRRSAVGGGWQRPGQRHAASGQAVDRAPAHRG